MKDHLCPECGSPLMKALEEELGNVWDCKCGYYLEEDFRGNLKKGGNGVVDREHTASDILTEE